MRALNLRVDDATAARVERLATEHDMTPEQVVARALQLAEHLLRRQAKGEALYDLAPDGELTRLVLRFGTSP